MNKDNDQNLVFLLVASNMNTVNNGLKAKYGDPVDETNPYSKIQTSIRETYEKVIAVLKLSVYASNLSASSKAQKLKQVGSEGNSYVVELDDGIVMIDHYFYSLMDHFWLHNVCYEYFTYEEVEEKLHPNEAKIVDDL